VACQLSCFTLTTRSVVGGWELPVAAFGRDRQFYLTDLAEALASPGKQRDLDAAAGTGMKEIQRPRICPRPAALAASAISPDSSSHTPKSRPYGTSWSGRGDLWWCRGDDVANFPRRRRSIQRRLEARAPAPGGRPATLSLCPLRRSPRVRRCYLGLRPQRGDSEELAGRLTEDGWELVDWFASWSRCSVIRR